MQKVLKKIIAVFSAFSFAAVMMFSPVIGSPVWSATLISAEEQPVTDESKGIAALLTLLFANGIRFVGEWENVSDGAVKMWNDFTTATGNTVTLAALGAGVALQRGYMRASASVNNAVNAFQTWYTGAFNVPPSGDVNLPVVPGAYNYKLIEQGMRCGTAYIDTMSGSDVRAVALRNGSNVYLWFVSLNSFSMHFSRDSGSGASLDGGSFGGVFYTSISSTATGAYKIFREGWVSAGYPVIDVASNKYNDRNTAYLYTFGAEAGLPDVSIGGQSYELKDGYNLNTDQSLLLDIANLSALVASIGLTLDSINDLVQDWPAIFDTPWADTDVPDITFPVPIEDTPDNTIPWVNVPDAVSPDPVPDYVPDNPETEGEYKVLGLENVFPFSIPFDLYYLVNVLVAEPETPSFTYALYDPTTSSLVSQEVNLHQFDTFAALLRKLETVLFIASLIFVTRGLIRS